MMQFNMYHHYTVDEHIIRTIGVLNQIERLEAAEEHPVATEILKGELNRRVLYVALLLHDIGKGDPRDHSELGAEIAERLCPRLGLTEAETETVTWLVRHHLLMSDTAQKRDIADPRTVADFAKHGAEPAAAAPAAGADRLRHPRRRPGRLEQLEGAASARPLLGRPRRADRRRRARRAGARASRRRARRWPRRWATGRRTRARGRASAGTTRITGWASTPRRMSSSPSWRATPPAARWPRASCRTRAATPPRPASTWPTIRACSRAWPAPSRWPAPTSSTRAATRRMTAWRPRSSGSRTATGTRSRPSACRKLRRTIERTLRGEVIARAALQRARPAEAARADLHRADAHRLRQRGLRPLHRHRGQRPRPARPAARADPDAGGRSTSTSSRRSSPPMASTPSTSSTSRTCSA